MLVAGRTRHALYSAPCVVQLQCMGWTGAIQFTILKRVVSINFNCKREKIGFSFAPRHVLGPRGGGTTGAALEQGLCLS